MSRSSKKGPFVDERDQVRTICLEPDSFILLILVSSRSSTNGPFFELRLNASPSRGAGRGR